MHVNEKCLNFITLINLPINCLNKINNQDGSASHKKLLPHCQMSLAKKFKILYVLTKKKKIQKYAIK